MESGRQMTYEVSKSGFSLVCIYVGGVLQGCLGFVLLPVLG